MDESGDLSVVVPAIETAMTSPAKSDDNQNLISPFEDREKTIKVLKEPQNDSEHHQKEEEESSDNTKKLRPKLLESETDKRNSSTSNAGESEYESANEDDPLQSTAKSHEETIPKEEEAKEVAPTVTTSQSACDKEVINAINESDVKDNYKVKVEKHESWADLNKSDNECDTDEDIDEDGSSDEDDDTDYEDSFNDADEEDETGDGVEKDKTKSNREKADGEEAESVDSKTSLSPKVKAAKKIEREDKRHPQYIPRKGPFYEHDDRNDVVAGLKPKEDVEPNPEGAKPKKKLLASGKLRSDDMSAENDVKAAEEPEKDFNKLNNKLNKSVSKEAIDEAESPVQKKVLEESPKEKTVHKEEPNPDERHRRKPIWDVKDRWNHDKFNQDEQLPKSKQELITCYGYDIRSENDAPKLQRGKKYGKGQQKYDRTSDDANAYIKRSLRNALKGSNIIKSPPKKDESINDNNNNNKNNNGINTSNRQTSREAPATESRNSSERKFAPKEGASSEGTSYSPKPSNPPRVETSRVLPYKSGKLIYNSPSGNRTESKPNQNHYNNTSNEVPSQSKLNKVDKVFGDNKKDEIFSKEDFPELTSKPKTEQLHTANDSQKNSRVIYYSNSTSSNSNSTKTDSLPRRYDSNRKSSAPAPIQHSNRTTIAPISSAPTKEINSNESVPLIKSQMFENKSYNEANSNYSPRHYDNRRHEKAYPPSQHQQQYMSSKHNMGENDKMDTSDGRPKRYSAIRQQQQGPSHQHQRGQPHQQTSNNSQQQQQQQPATVHRSSANATSNTYQSARNQNQPHQQQQQQQQQQRQAQTGHTYSAVPQPEPNSMNISVSQPTDSNAKNISYYQTTGVAVNDIGHNARQQQQPLLTQPIVTSANHHHSSVSNHNYVSINGNTTLPMVAVAPETAFHPAAQAALVAFFDQSAGGAPQAGTQPTPGLASSIPYYGADQAAAAQPAPNYYITAPELAASYHPAYHLPANYQPSVATHQSHITSRYLTTTPSTSSSTDPARYMQQTAGQQPPQLLMPSGVANLAGQAPYGQSTFSLGYPQFPSVSAATPTLDTSSPLPAGYPNIPIGTSAPAPTTAQQPSSYGEVYRGGITYYDISSQQQQRQQFSQQQQPQNRRVTKQGGDSKDHGDSGDKKHPNENGISMAN